MGREEEAMGMGDRPPSYSASNSMVVSPDPRMSVGPSFRHQTHKGGEGARAERNMAVGFKTVELVLVLSIVGLVRLGGKDWTPIFLGSVNTTFLAYGGAVASSLVTPCLLVARALGASPGPLDLLLTGLGAMLFTIIGTLAALYEKGDGNQVMEMGKQFMRALTGTSTSPNKDGAILAVCILTLVTAVILLIDFIIMARSVRNRRWKEPNGV